MASGLLLVLRVRGVRGNRPRPPLRALLAADLAGHHVLLVRPVLHLDQGIRAHVVVPHRMLRGAALGPHHGVPAVVLDPHDRRLPPLPPPPPYLAPIPPPQPALP